MPQSCYPIIIIPKKISDAIIGIPSEEKIRKKLGTSRPTFLELNKAIFSIFKEEVAPASRVIEITPSKKGKSEPYFLKSLLRRFEDQVKVDVAPEDTPYYFPDFTFICRETGVHIDIEVDEPYAFRYNQPIHTSESLSDDTRDDSFLDDQNWCIIRLTEKQVMTQTEQCLDLIESVVDIIRHKDIRHNIKFNLIQERKWTTEEAIEKALRKERDDYFPAK